MIFFLFHHISRLPVVWSYNSCENSSLAQSVAVSCTNRSAAKSKQWNAVGQRFCIISLLGVTNPTQQWSTFLSSESSVISKNSKFSLSGKSELLQILNSCKWGYYYFENQGLCFLYARYYCFCFKWWIREKCKYIECNHALERIFNNNNLALSSYMQMLHCNQVNNIAHTALP